MNATRDDAGLPTSLASRLRREARGTRPEFSDAFHARLMERLSVESMSLPPPCVDTPRRRRDGLERVAVPAAGALVLAVIVAVLVSVRGHDKTSPDATPLVLQDRQVAVTVPVVGLESIPMYDDIDAGVREGVWMLASSLVEVPAWARLADFDAPATPFDAPGP